MSVIELPRRAVPAQADGSVGRLWVAVGGLWLTLCVWAWGGWIVSGDFKANTLGRALAPQSYKVFIHSVEVFAVLVTALILWRFVVRDRLRTGSFTFDALFFLSCWMLLIQEPWINWNHYQFMYSTVAVNFGSWTSHIPLWSSPRSQLVPLPIVWVGTAYLWLVAIPAWAGSRLMSRLRDRHPDIGMFRLLATTYAAFVAFDLVLETFIVRTGLFNYASTVPSLTLFAGKTYQFPLYETVSWCGTYLGLACIHQFRDKLKFAGAGKALPRFLAIMGACQVVMLFTYNIPYLFWGSQAGPVQSTLAQQPWRDAGVSSSGPRSRPARSPTHARRSPGGSAHRAGTTQPSS